MSSAHSNTSSVPFSSAGKANCARNAGAICSSLAALCSIRTPGSVHFQPSFEDIFRGRRSAHYATDQQSRLSDLAFLKTIGQCFCYELCRYSTSLTSCEAIFRSGIEQILGHFFECLVDTDILHRLPSSNKNIISRAGGPKAQEKEVKYLKRMLRHAPSEGQEDEAMGARLLGDESFDSPGPAFMASRLWSFSRVLGDAISRTAALPSDAQMLGDIAKILSESDSDIAADMSESCLRSLTLVPLISMERECMKRFMRLRGVVSAIFSQKHQAVGRIGANIISLLTKTILQNIYYLSATVEYNDRRTNDWSANTNADHEDLYERARVLALQRTYTVGASAFLAWVLREGARRHDYDQQQMNRPMLLIRDVVLRTSLQRTSADFCSVLEGQSTASSFTFDLLTSQGIASAAHGAQSNRLAEDLAAGIGRRMNELTLYAAATYDSSNASDVLSLLIESALDTTSPESNRSTLLGCALRGEQSGSGPPFGGNVIYSDGLQGAIDAYLSTVRRSMPLCTEDIALLGTLRRVALRNFFVPKLCFPTIAKEKKARILQIMSSLFDIGKDAHQICYSIQTHDESKGFLDIADLCLAARGLIYILKETIASWKHSDSATVQIIFRVARLLIRLPVSEGQIAGDCKPMLEWIRLWTLNGEESRPAKFILQFSRWMNKMARLLTNDECIQIVQRVATSATDDFETEAFRRPHRWTLQVFDDLHLNNGEADLSAIEAITCMLDIAEQLDTLEDELYPEDQVITTARASVKNVYAKRSVPLMAMQSNSKASSNARGENPSTLMLNPRCKRSAKGYIANYIALS